MKLMEIIHFPGQKTASLRNGANGLMLEVGALECKLFFLSTATAVEH